MIYLVINLWLFFGAGVVRGKKLSRSGILLRPLETNVMPKSSGDPKGVIGGT